jgi:tetrahydromethanopterin S-methyltransferase subunit G
MKKGSNKKPEKKPEITTIREAFDSLRKSTDFVFYKKDHGNVPYVISYFSSIVDAEIIHQYILPNLLQISDLEELKSKIPIEEIIDVTSPKDLTEKLPSGYVYIYFTDSDHHGVLIPAQKDDNRSISPPEVEFSVVGPKESFIESLDTNIYLIRKRLPIDSLRVEKFTIGDLSNTEVACLYIEDIADEENINTVRQRLNEIDFDAIGDTAYISQIIADNQRSPFPQILDTERPDRVATALAEGKLAILVDRSPHALIGPTTFNESISTFEDYLLNWYAASFIRIVRIASIAFSILITPIYVATLTYHYELIPKDLLATLITSRRAIPLPPILEALFLELTIELLREAGARLPTKVGQTIGIVGGIVIGTASVEAGLTSNVLLIMVALAALASFTTPTYQFGNTIRLIRFPFLLFAHAWGLIGIVLCFSLLAGHLLQLTSLGRPYLEPFYPTRVRDLKDTIIRLPFSKLSRRPVQNHPEQKKRFSPKDERVHRDIDE